MKSEPGADRGTFHSYYCWLGRRHNDALQLRRGSAFKLKERSYFRSMRPRRQLQGFFMSRANETKVSGCLFPDASRRDEFSPVFQGRERIDKRIDRIVVVRWSRP